MQNNKTTVCYRCPDCGAILTFDVTRERLDKGLLSMRCIQCSKSKLDIMLTPDDTVNLTVPCLICPHSHPYRISKEAFFNKEIYCFTCSYSGLDICFIGQEDLVDEEIIRTGREIRELSELSGANSQDDSDHANLYVADSNVVREVMFAIGNLQEDKKIKCTCGASSVKVLIDYDKIDIICKVCAKKKSIASRTKFDANAAIELEEIIID